MSLLVEADVAIEAHVVRALEAGVTYAHSQRVEVVAHGHEGGHRRQRGRKEQRCAILHLFFVAEHADAWHEQHVAACGYRVESGLMIAEALVLPSQRQEHVRKQRVAPVVEVDHGLRGV